MLIDELLDYSDKLFLRTENAEKALKNVAVYRAADQGYKNLIEKGGVHAFSRGLRLFGLTNDPEAKNILWWNERETWKTLYGDSLKDCWSFAEDVFGNQFIFNSLGVSWLNTETGEVSHLCDTFMQWISIILKDPNFYTGASLAGEWDKSHPNEALNGQYYLCPTTPFVCGGSYDIENLFRYDAVKCMLLKADIARQIKDLPNGADIEIKLR